MIKMIILENGQKMENGQKNLTEGPNSDKMYFSQKRKEIDRDG